MLVASKGIDQAKIVPISLGADPDLLYPLNSSEVAGLRRKYNCEKRMIILTVGNLITRKGQDMVIRALPKVIREIPDILYLIAGMGKDEMYFKELAESLGISRNIRFMGAVNSREMVRELYNICDIFVMVSRLDERAGSVENFGIVYLEANACGKPVIGGKSGGVPEAIVDGETGLLVDPENPGDIAQAILKLLNDRELAHRLGEKGRRRVVEYLNWKNVGLRVGEICREVVAEYRGNGVSE
jgi:phosphatidylinositol alpha-1,6-mannosyltransferase